MSSTTEQTLQARTRQLNDHAPDGGGRAVVYVMARDVRLRDNYALAEAQALALHMELPLVVLFCLQPATGRRAREHYQFLLDGLRQVEQDLAARDIGFGLRLGRPQAELPRALADIKPAAVYFDMSPLRGPRKLHRDIARAAHSAAVFETDAHNLVPVWAASSKQEVGARTLRPKIMRQYADWLEDTPRLRRHPHVWAHGRLQGFQPQEKAVRQLITAVPANGTDLSRFKPGEPAADAALKQFVDERLRGYADARNDPAVNGQSNLNPYLHYGQLASARVVRAVEQAAADDSSLRPDANALIEEMVVRKELSDNFCFYNNHYDSLSGAPDWARATLDKHRDDKRDFTYTRRQFEAAQTHDDAWNAAQTELRQTGKIHGYMRMYWAKKVLEWSGTPETALKTLLYLNDHYHVDGGDPSGYVGILWSIAGLHDRPWFERPVYGSVRYMNANGLKRKFKIDSYIDTYI